MSRIPMNKRPGIIWVITTPTPRKGIENIISDLRTERYSPCLSEDQLDMDNLDPTFDLTPNPILTLNVRKGDTPYGTVAITYIGDDLDRTTSQYMAKQCFSVYFNMGAESYQERNYFIRC